MTNILIESFKDFCWLSFFLYTKQFIIGQASYSDRIKEIGNGVASTDLWKTRVFDIQSETIQMMMILIKRLWYLLYDKNMK